MAAKHHRRELAAIGGGADGKPCAIRFPCRPRHTGVGGSVNLAAIHHRRELAAISGGGDGRPNAIRVPCRPGHTGVSGSVNLAAINHRRELRAIGRGGDGFPNAIRVPCRPDWARKLFGWQGKARRVIHRRHRERECLAGGEHAITDLHRDVGAAVRIRRWRERDRARRTRATKDDIGLRYQGGIARGSAHGESSQPIRITDGKGDGTRSGVFQRGLIGDDADRRRFIHISNGDGEGLLEAHRWAAVVRGADAEGVAGFGLEISHRSELQGVARDGEAGVVRIPRASDEAEGLRLPHIRIGGRERADRGPSGVILSNTGAGECDVRGG